EPDPALPAVARLEAGARAWQIDVWPGWVRVESADGARGWIPDEQVFALER
ncbi:MAG: aspartyl-trna synthetase, partial [Planctomycetes bacterium]|nr:aspartyl-trna synthetase [Planctomycetota bacterium]